MRVDWCKNKIYDIDWYLFNWRHIFSVFDINHDGTIDFVELLLSIAATSKTGLDNELEFVFEIWIKIFLDI
jgi:hypothetical protein